jgi:hypothetical protein
MEAGVVVDVNGHVIHWHTPPGRTAGSIPDTPDLWSVFWNHREELLGFAHSHPGAGFPGPSHTDVTTFRAVERALGRRLVWWITSENVLAVCQWTRRSRKEPGTWIPVPAADDDWQTRHWLKKLRRISYGR